MSDLWAEIEALGPQDGPKWFERIGEKGYDPIADRSLMDSFKRRDRFTKSYAWAYPTKGAIATIIEFAAGERILEIGAGLGLWARLLRDAGADIVATDLFSGRKNYFREEVPDFTEVVNMGHREAVMTYPHGVLMLCWPPYSEPMAFEALNDSLANKLVYIGEGDSGCTGDGEFHDMIDENYEWVEHKTDIKRWDGLHDSLHLYKRRGVTRRVRME